MTNYLDLSILEINDLLKKKTIKPIDLVLEAFEKIEKSDLNSFITLNKDEAIKEAKELENINIDNVMFGIPIALKDNIITKDLRTTCASHMLDDYVPVYDATVIKKIKEKHMIIIGKTNMDEFAMGSTTETSFFGPVLNPWNKKMVAGGSSGGSAAAVSARLVSVALASDTGGSIRQPSSFCGLVGMKPTYGRVSRYGLVPFASSLDQIGAITKTVIDNALVLNTIQGFDEKDLNTKDINIDNTHLIGNDVKGLKIAVPNYYMSDVINNEVKNAVLKVIDLLKEKGCIINYVDVNFLEFAIPLYQIIALGEASSNLARFDGIKYGYVAPSVNNINEWFKETRSEGFGSEVKRRIMIGSYVLSGDNADKYYKKALKLRRILTDNLINVFEDYDLIIGPTNTDVAYPLGTISSDALKAFYDDLLTIPVNMAGLPGLSMPIGFNSKKLPIGMHIIGNYFKEDVIYSLASFIEKELNLDLNPGGEI